MPALSKASANREVVALFGEVLVDVFPDRRVMGGAPFNVARHLQAFGLHPLLITRTGNDALREQLLESMARYGMDKRGVQCDMERPSGQVIVRMQGREHSFEILPEQAYDYIDAGQVEAITHTTQPRLIYFGTLAQRNLASRRALTTLLHNTNSPCLLDINLRTPWYDLRTVVRSLRRANTVKLNNDELEAVSAALSLPEASTEQQATALMRKFKLQRLLLTCGDKGARLFDSTGLNLHASSIAQVQIIDTVGAGDGFAAVLILGMLRSWPEQLTLERANTFAAALCGIRGATPDEQDFYMPFLENWEICQPLH